MRLSKKDIEKVTRIFRPSAPVEDPKMFVGREEQRHLLHRALLAPGRHVALYGQRGVGKTSLLNIVTLELEEDKIGSILRYTCSHKDTYGDIFRKFLDCTNQLFQQQKTRKKTVRNLESKVKIPIAEGGINSTYEEESTIFPVFDHTLTPDTIATKYCTHSAIFFIDEFDRILSSETKELIAETIKILADQQSKTKIVLSGVSNSALDLIGAHPSTIRNVLTLELPPMSASEIEELIKHGFRELRLDIISSVHALIVRAANGLPYFAHLLCEELAVRALRQNKRRIEEEDFFAVLNSALSNISSAVHGSFEAIFQVRSRGFTDKTFSHFISTPIAMRRIILMAFALAPKNDFEHVGSIVNQLAAKGNEFIPKKYRDIDDTDVQVVLEEICELSDLLIMVGDNISFRDSFSRGYTWLQAAKKFGKEAIIRIVQ